MQVFLTGATGFVGSALLNRLLADGAEVSALVRQDSVVLPDGVNKVVGDLAGLNGGFQPVGHPSVLPQGDISRALVGCDVVVHTAARAHIIRDEAADPLAAYRKVNRDATIALAHLAAQAGVKRFIFISTINVLGDNSSSPYTEQSQPNPIQDFAIAKYEAEQRLFALARETRMEVVIIRPPLVYGSNAPGNFGSLVKWVKKGVPLPLGTVCNLRSLVALDNLVDFIALCSDRERSPKAANEVFLISDGVDVSTTELLRKVAKACGVKSRLLPVPVGLMRFAARLLGKGAVADRLFGNLKVDSSKARDLLGWEPVVTMDEALERMFEGKSL